MALGKRNNGNFRLSSVEVGAPRIWIHLNRIRKKQMEEKIGTGHSLHDVVSLQLFSSHLNQSEPHSNHVNRRKTRTHGAKLPLLIHHQKGSLSAVSHEKTGLSGRGNSDCSYRRCPMSKLSARIFQHKRKRKIRRLTYPPCTMSHFAFLRQRCAYRLGKGRSMLRTE